MLEQAEPDEYTPDDVPRNKAGKQWAMQYIQEDGTKRFAKDSKKEGCFHPVGGIEAVAAARVVGGKAVMPVFAPGEADYPAGLAPVTPQSYRAHLHATRALETTTDPDRKAKLEKLEKALLSKEQQAALTRIKRYTDFNDLATQSRLGREGVERQVRATVNKAVVEAQQKQQQRQQQTYQQKQRRTRHAVNM